MMDKDIFRLLNEVETDLEQYQEEPLLPLEKKRIQKRVFGNFKHRGRGFKLAAAGIMTVFISTGIMFNQDIYAFVESVTYKVASIWDLGGLDNYVNVVNKSETDKGCKITLNEVILDNDELIISSTITGEDKIGSLVLMDGILKINGKMVTLGASGALKTIDEYTQESIEIYDIPNSNVKLTGNNKIEYKIKKIYLADEAGTHTELTGDWSFSFMASGEQLIIDTVTVPLNHTITAPDGRQITLTKYTGNSVGQKIYFDIADEKGMDYLFELRGQDDLGNEINFAVSDMNKKNGRFKISTMENAHLDSNASSLTLYPYYVEMTRKSGQMESDYQKIDQQIVIDIPR